MAFLSVHSANPRRMMRHTTHLPTVLRPTRNPKRALHRARAIEIVRGIRPGAETTAHVVQAVAGEEPSAHVDSLYPARERAAGGPQDQALYGCGCGYAFLAPVEAGVHCPQCGGEQSW